jgi:hypothetical protein
MEIQAVPTLVWVLAKHPAIGAAVDLRIGNARANALAAK